MARPPVAGSQITYGQFRKTEEWTEERILAQVAEAGFEGAPAGPRKDRSPKETAATYAKFGLRCAPGYFSGDYWKPDQREKILEGAKAQAAAARELGNDTLYVATGGFGNDRAPSGKTRNEVAGHASPAESLGDDDFKQFCEVLSEVGRVMQREGVAACFHNHVGSFVETRAEIDKMMSMVDRSVVFLGPDSGHLAWAGADVVQFFKDYATSIKTVHLKDIYPDVLKKGVAEKWDYGTFTSNGVFAELGEGLIDFPAAFKHLTDAGFGGWIISEIDRTTKPTALQSLKICRTYLKSIGF